MTDLVFVLKLFNTNKAWFTSMKLTQNKKQTQK